MKRGKYAWLYLAISCLYILTGSGRLGGVDSVSMFRVGVNIADHGNVRSEPCTPDQHNPQCLPGVDGHYYTSYGILPSLVSAATYIAAKIVTRFLHLPLSVIAGFFIVQVTALVAAAVPVAMAWWIERMGYSWGAACFAAVALAFGTPFWFYGVKQFFSEPYMTLPLILSAIVVLYGTGWRWFAAAGLLLGLACTARIVAVLALPLFFGVLLWRRRQTPGMWRDAASFLAGAGAMFLSIGLYNFTRFGSFTNSGYSSADVPDSHPSITAIFKGIESFLFQPDNSLLYFAPLVILAPWGAVLLYRKHRLDAIVGVGTFLLYFLAFSAIIQRPAAWCYGPRYLVPVLPFLLVTLAAVWDRVRQGASWQRGAAIALVALSIGIHVVGTVYPLSLYYWRHGWVLDRTGNDEYPGYLRSMFVELPYVIEETAHPQPSHGIADPLASETSNAASFPNFEAFLKSLPNPINVVGADLWLVKFAILMRAPWICGALALLLLGGGGWFLSKGLATAD